MAGFRASLWVSIVLSVCLVSGVQLASAKTGQEWNKEALEKAYANDLEGALPLFRSAVAADARNPEFLNNLGVTEMRLGRLKDARKHFEGALKLDPGHNEARMNIKDLEQYEGPSKAKEAKAKARAEDTGPPHATRKMPRITLSQFLDNKEYYIHQVGRAPFVLTDAFRGTWSTAQTKWTLDYFKRNFGTSIVDFYPHNMDDEKVRPYLTPLTTVVDEIVSPSGNFPTDPEHPGTYAQWNIDVDDWTRLEEDFGWLPEYFQSDDAWLYGTMADYGMIGTFLKGTHWRMLLIGTKGAGMFNHVDTLRTASFQAQLLGAKKWHLCGPSENKYMYGAGDVDFFNPDYLSFPLARNASCYLDTIKAGEMAFYPRDWWHQTENMEDINMAITGTLADANNFDTIAEEISKDCNRENPTIIPKNPVMCKQLDDVTYPWWREAWEGDFLPIKSSKERKCSRDSHPPFTKL